MWLFEEILRKRGIRNETRVEFWAPGPAMFGIKKYADMLSILQRERNIIPHFKTELMSIDGPNKKATFKDNNTGAITIEDFTLLHVVPFQSPPEFIRNSKLANATGFVDVDKHTLQSTKYPNIFGIGDCTNTPNSKTAAAITSQAPVLVHNLERLIEGKDLNGRYNGYASCPLIISRSEVILAEFGYDG